MPFDKRSFPFYPFLNLSHVSTFVLLVAPFLRILKPIISSRHLFYPHIFTVTGRHAAWHLASAHIPLVYQLPLLYT